MVIFESYVILNRISARRAGCLDFDITKVEMSNTKSANLGKSKKILIFGALSFISIGRRILIASIYEKIANTNFSRVHRFRAEYQNKFLRPQKLIA